MTRKRMLYQELARLVQAIHNCEKTGNIEWKLKHADNIARLCYDRLPHGSGIDGERMTVNLDQSTENKLVIGPVDFHHMDPNGFYAGWSEHTCIVRPSLTHGIDITITGRNRDGIKEHLYKTMYFALTTEWEETY